MVGKLNHATSFDLFLQQLLALLERDATQVEAIEVKQIERIIDDRNAFAPWQAALAGLESGPLLHQAERRAALFIERDDLSVEDGALGFYELRQAAEFGKLRGKVILSARHQTHAAVFDESDGAVTVPFDFKQPVRIVESVRNGGRKHRTDHGWHGLLFSALEIFNCGRRGVRGGFFASRFWGSRIGRGPADFRVRAINADELGFLPSFFSAPFALSAVKALLFYRRARLRPPTTRP